LGWQKLLTEYILLSCKKWKKFLQSWFCFWQNKVVFNHSRNWKETFLELLFLILFWPFLLWLSFVVSHFSFLSSLICFNLSSALHIFHLWFCSFYNCLFFRLFVSFFSFLWWLCRCQINPAIWMKRLRCICLSKDSRHYFSCSSWGKWFLLSFFLFWFVLHFSS